MIADFTVAYLDYRNQMVTMDGFMSSHKDSSNNLTAEEIHPFKYDLGLMSFEKYYNHEMLEEIDNSLRYTIPGKDGEKSIIVFGCSFAYGSFLDDNETFEYKLSKATGRTVYNRGLSGFGLSQMVWQTKFEPFYENIKVEPEYAIYIYIHDHLRRIYEGKYGHINIQLAYKEKDNSLVEDKPIDLQLNRFYIYKNFVKNITFRRLLSKENADKNFDLIKMHFIESRKELQKKYPNMKFIIIKHPFGLKNVNEKDIYYLEDSYSTARWKELEDDGFIVFDLKQINGVDFESDEYTFPDGHPNSKAWDIVVKELVKKLNL